MSILQPTVNLDDVGDENIFEIDVQNGSCYVWCWWLLLSRCTLLPCYCFAYKLVSSQEISFVNDKLNYKYDCYCCKEDKMVPLDRIQDININENFCHRLWGVSEVVIQTATGSNKPEITITAPKHAHKLRDVLIARRDAVCYAEKKNVESISREHEETSPLITEISRDINDVNNILVRIESQLQRGVELVRNKT